MRYIIRDTPHPLHERLHLLQHLIHKHGQNTNIALLFLYLQSLVCATANDAGNILIQPFDSIQCPRRTKKSSCNAQYQGRN